LIEFVNDIGVKLVNVSASDEMVAMAAWVSNGLDDETRLEDKEKVRGLINFLYRNKHMSPFEHGVFTFKVDVPLFVAREWHRHRTMSYNEVSGRYTQMQPRFWRADTARVQQGKMGNYYFVDGSDEQTALYRRKKEIRLQNAWDDYLDLLDAGIAKEQAREDLPLSLMTQFYATANPRNIMQFLTLRNDSHALKEIRLAAEKVEKFFAQHMPYTYDAYRAGRDGYNVNINLDDRSSAEKIAKSIMRQINTEGTRRL
jgi:thymidylate synthase (FAD)